jgi:hypothetical protein
VSATVVEATTADQGDAERPAPVHVVERVKDGRMFWVIDADPNRKVVTLGSRTGHRRFVDEATLLKQYRPLRKVAA